MPPPGKSGHRGPWRVPTRCRVLLPGPAAVPFRCPKRRHFRETSAPTIVPRGKLELVRKGDEILGGGRVVISVHDCDDSGPAARAGWLRGGIRAAGGK